MSAPFSTPPFVRERSCMNDPDATASDSLRWLRFSAEDLDVAGILLMRHPPATRHVCWLSQQAAEKALKAALVLEGIEFPFTHDLDALRNRLPDGWSVSAAHIDLAELTQWAVESRYPGDWPDASESDAVSAERGGRCRSRLGGGRLQTAWIDSPTRQRGLTLVTRSAASSWWRWRVAAMCASPPA